MGCSDHNPKHTLAPGALVVFRHREGTFVCDAESAATLRRELRRAQVRGVVRSIKVYVPAALVMLSLGALALGVAAL